MMCNAGDKDDSMMVKVIFWDIRDVWVVGRALPHLTIPGGNIPEMNGFRLF